jgi:hypothetical protein
LSKTPTVVNSCNGEAFSSEEELRREYFEKLYCAYNSFNICLPAPADVTISGQEEKDKCPKFYADEAIGIGNKSACNESLFGIYTATSPIETALACKVHAIPTGLSQYTPNDDACGGRNAVYNVCKYYDSRRRGKRNKRANLLRTNNKFWNC